MILYIKSIAQRVTRALFKFKFDLQRGSLTDQVAGEHQPSKKQGHFQEPLQSLQGGRTIDDEWSVCCCALVDAYQNKVPNNPSASESLPEIHNNLLNMTEINGLKLQ